MTIRWPEEVLRPQSVSFDIAPRTLAGPTSVSGLAQVVASDAGIWKARLGAVIIRKRQHVLAWRGIDVWLEGRLGTILVPFCGHRPSLAVSSGYPLSVPHSDGSFFSDTSGYVTGLNGAYAVGSLAVRATSATIEIPIAGLLEPGHHFSIGERFYRIRTVTYTGETTANITFRPPLREAVSAGAALEFDDPVCRMRLASDDEMRLDLQHGRFAEPSVNFIEAL